MIFLKNLASSRISNPVAAAMLKYVLVFTVIGWSNYIFRNYRVMGTLIFLLLPLVSTVIMYLWIIFLLDEFLYILKTSGPIRTAIGKIKYFSLIIIAIYATAASVYG